MNFLYTIALLSALLFPGSSVVANHAPPFSDEKMREGITFQDAIDSPVTGTLPIMECNEELMYCLTHTADTMEYSLGFSRDDETSWGVYDTWGELCGAVTAQFDAAKCYLCGSKSYPLIHQECSHEERRLSGHVWTLFDSFKEERRRRLQKDFDDVPKDPNVRNGGLKKDPIVGNRGLQDTCPYKNSEIGYPSQQDTSYLVLVGPLLAPIALDINIPVNEIDFGDDDEAFTADKPIVPGGATFAAILPNFQTRTNQDLVASVMIVGTVLELLIPVIETICQIIPDPVCFLGCFTNPFRFGCFIIVGIARVILQVYKFFEVGWTLHDPVIDGAEILATLTNTETMVEASCQLASDTADLSALLSDETDEIDGILNDGFCERDFTSTCSLKGQTAALADQVDRQITAVLKVTDAAAFDVKLETTKSVLNRVKYSKSVLVFTTVEGMPVDPASIVVTAYDADIASSSSEDNMFNSESYNLTDKGYILSEVPVTILSKTNFATGKTVVSFQSKMDIFFIKAGIDADMIDGRERAARERTEMVTFK